MHGPTHLRRWSCDCREILDHITSASSHVTICVYLLKKWLNRQWSELFPAARVPLYRHFSPCHLRFLNTPIMFCFDAHCWSSWPSMNSCPDVRGFELIKIVNSKVFDSMCYRLLIKLMPTMDISLKLNIWLKKRHLGQASSLLVSARSHGVTTMTTFSHTCSIKPTSLCQLQRDVCSENGTDDQKKVLQFAAFSDHGYQID